jgi:branched-chain amino acid transport system ATP-binding protein
MAILEVRDVKKSFGGIRAVDRCSLTVEPRSITGLIGPNGAGKSTLFNIIAGLYRPDGGEILFAGERPGRDGSRSKRRTLRRRRPATRGAQRIDGLPPYSIVQLGLTKTWQIPHELKKLTVLENLVLAARGHHGDRFTNLFLRPRLVRRDEERFRKQAQSVLAMTQLGSMAHEEAASLSGGQKKLLELARALMTDPALVLLDEPVAGVNLTLASSLMDLIEQLRQQGRTFFLIEHDMNVVMKRCDTVIVMHEGRKIAEGTPEAVRRDPVVIDSYLGG